MTSGTPHSSCFILYDAVFLSQTLTAGTLVNAPDSTNTGTLLQEDTTTGYHEVVIPYSSISGNPITTSIYALEEDTNRSLSLSVAGNAATFNGSLLTNQLTISSLLSGSLSVGMVIIGPGIPPNTTIVSGSSSPYTISYTAPTIIASSAPPVIYTMSAVSYIAKSIFNLATQVITNITGTSSIQSLGNGIYRCSVSGTEGITGTNYIGIGLYNNNNNQDNYSGNGGSYIGIWGCQIQENSTKTPYILTQGIIESDYVTTTLSTGTVLFNQPPQSGAILSWTGSVNGISPEPVDFMATFNYMEAAPNYIYLGTNPMISLSYSDDGGHSFSPERAISCGKLGQYKTRAIWRKLGQSRDRVFKISCVEPIKLTLLSAEIWANESTINRHD